MKCFFPLLSLLLLLSFLAPLPAQEGDADRHRWSNEGWVMGVGGLGTYSSFSSPGLDAFYASYDFQGYTPSPIVLSTSLVLAWPRFWFEGEFGKRMVSEEEVENWGLIRSEGSLMGLRFGYTVNDPGSSLRIVPTVGLLSSTTILDLLTDTENSDLRTHRDLRIFSITPGVSLSIKLDPILSLQLSGGYSLPLTASWTDMDRDIEPSVEVDGRPEVRLGLVLNAVDALMYGRRE